MRNAAKKNEYHSKIKGIYREFADKIWEKRYNSPYVIRRYLHRTQYHTILKYIKELNPDSILDYGCGEGVLSVLIKEKECRVVGIDISASNINTAERTAKERRLEIDFVVGDGEKLPFKDKSFNLVVVSHSLEHLPNITAGFAEIKRVADMAVIAVPTCLSLCSLSLLRGDAPWRITLRTPFALPLGLFKVIRNLRKIGVPQGYAGKEELPHPWFYPWKFKRVLEENGFRILKVEAGSLCPPYISWLFPKSIKFFEFVDRYKDKKLIRYLGYGTTYFVEVKR